MSSKAYIYEDVLVAEVLVGLATDTRKVNCVRKLAGGGGGGVRAAARIPRLDPQTRGSGVQRFRGGLVFKAHRLLYHSALGLRVIKKKRRCMDPSSCWNSTPGSANSRPRCSTGEREIPFLIPGSPLLPKVNRGSTFALRRPHSRLLSRVEKQREHE